MAGFTGKIEIATICFITAGTRAFGKFMGEAAHR